MNVRLTHLATQSFFSFCLMRIFMLGCGVHGLPRWLGGKESVCQCRRHGLSPWVRKTPLEKEIATHSSILSWKVPWTEEPGGLQSTGSQ